MEFDINQDFINFYTNFYKDRDKAIELLNRCYEFGDVSLVPRRLVNN